MKNRIALGAVALLASLNIFASAGVAGAAIPNYTPELVYTVVPSGVNNDNVISGMKAIGDKVFFCTGEQFFISDGTSAGTTDITQLFDDENISRVWFGTNHEDVNSIVVDGILYFFAEVGAFTEIVATDGTFVDVVTTELGDDSGGIYYIDGSVYVANDTGVHTVNLDTGAVTTIQGDYASEPSDSRFSVVGLNGKILFHYDNNTFDNHIVVWNPSTPLDAPIAIEPSSGGLGIIETDLDYMYDAFALFVWNNAAYFTAYGNDGTDTVGMELFKTDGTQGGTVLVKDINPGAGDSWPSYYGDLMFTELNGKLYFSATDITDDSRLYATDGTSAGTTLVDLDTFTDPGDNAEGQAPIVNGKMITSFYLPSADDEDWYATDGTLAGTEPLISDTADYSNSCYDECAEAVLFDGNAFFLAFDGDVNAVWVTDGTPAGTTPVTDSTFSPSAYGISDYLDDEPLVVAGENLFFALSDWDGTGVSALYKVSPGTLADTGTDAQFAVWAGFGLLAAGVMVVVARRRNA